MEDREGKTGSRVRRERRPGQRGVFKSKPGLKDCRPGERENSGKRGGKRRGKSRDLEEKGGKVK